ncbi:substrate-binding domain-containing protein [Verrucomicrobiaceae bacterium 227]
MRPILLKRVSKQASATLHLLTVIDSRHPPTPLDAETVMLIEDFWKAEGGEVSRVTGDLRRIKKPDSQLLKWLEASGADCLLFENIAPEWRVSVERLGLSCYALGGSLAYNDGMISASGFGIVRCMEGMLRDILEMGHRRILIVMGRALSEERMGENIQRRLAPILEEDWGREEVSLSFKAPDLANPSDWLDWWPTTLLSERPTVVLLDSVYQGVGFHGFCLSKGIKMPRDISMVVLEDAEFLEWLNPPPTRYKYRANDGFRHFKSWVRGGFVKGSIKVFGADLVGGRTLGPVPERALGKAE